MKVNLCNNPPFVLITFEKCTIIHGNPYCDGDGSEMDDGWEGDDDEGSR